MASLCLSLLTWKMGIIRIPTSWKRARIKCVNVYRASTSEPGTWEVLRACALSLCRPCPSTPAITHTRTALAWDILPNYIYRINTKPTALQQPCCFLTHSSFSQKRLCSPHTHVFLQLRDSDFTPVRRPGPLSKYTASAQLHAGTQGWGQHSLALKELEAEQETDMK